VPGQVIDGQLADETELVVEVEDEEDDELVFGVRLYRRGVDGPLIGFGAAGALSDTVSDDEDSPVWGAPRCDVSSLALSNASIGEILLGAVEALREPNTRSSLPS